MLPVLLGVALLSSGVHQQGQQPPPVKVNPKALTIRVIVVNYDPVLRTKGNKTLTQFMGWNNPRDLTPAIISSIKNSSGGWVNYQVVDFIDIDEFPIKRDGFRYTEQSYLAMWNNRDLAHFPDQISYKAVFDHNNLKMRIQNRQADEVWLWGAPYFGYDEYAMKLPQDQIFYPTDNPWFYRPYDIPEMNRTVWVMGFSYERGQAEAVHSYGHRCEGILSLTVGKGIWDYQRTPNNPWNHFTKQAKDFPNDAQCGNVHGGPNALSGYDYGQQQTVMSGADNWLKYPFLSDTKTPVNAETWGGPDYQLNFLRWWLAHLPKSAGVKDGFFNNWWQYIANYDDAVAKQPPPDGHLQKANNAMW